MNFKNLTLPLVIILSLISSIIYGLNLYNHHITQNLFYSTNFYTLAPIFFAICLIAFIFFAFKKNKTNKISSFSDCFSISNRALITLPIVSALTLVCSGSVILYNTFTSFNGFSIYLENKWSLVSIAVLAILTILAGISFYLTSYSQLKNKLTETRAFFLIIPMFWSCFDLITTFKENAANPIIYEFSNELFSAILIMYSFYHFSSFVFSTGKPRRFILFSSLSIFFILNTIIPSLILALMTNDFSALNSSIIFRYISFAAAGLFLGSNVFIITKKLNVQNRKDANYES